MYLRKCSSVTPQVQYTKEPARKETGGKKLTEAKNDTQWRRGGGGGNEKPVFSRSSMCVEIF